MNVSNMDMQQKLELAIIKAAKLLPGDVGEQLLAMLTPSALATMAAIAGVWAGAHFFGIGELADLILIVAGWVAVGGVAVEASKNSMNSLRPHTAPELKVIWMKQQPV